MTKNQAKQELAKELDNYIDKFKKAASRAGYSEQSYDYAMHIRRDYIPMLCNFAEKYLDIKIEVHEKKVNSQYNPGYILGYEIT